MLKFLWTLHDNNHIDADSSPELPLNRRTDWRCCACNFCPNCEERNAVLEADTVGGSVIFFHDSSLLLWFLELSLTSKLMCDCCDRAYHRGCLTEVESRGPPGYQCALKLFLNFLLNWIEIELSLDSTRMYIFPNESLNSNISGLFTEKPINFPYLLVTLQMSLRQIGLCAHGADAAAAVGSVRSSLVGTASVWIVRQANRQHAQCVDGYAWFRDFGKTLNLCILWSFFGI